MTCKHITLEVEDHLHVAGQPPRTTTVTAIVCDRGSRRPRRCQEPGCTRPHTKLCDFPVTRKGKKTTCSRKLCDGHAFAAEHGLDFCRAHAEYTPPPPKTNTERDGGQQSLF